MCGVGRTTVGYWIRTGKLPAQRHRRNYAIAVADLRYFLKSNGQSIPAPLIPKSGNGPIYKRFQSCWEYHRAQGTHAGCEGCIVAQQQIADCFTLPSSQVPCRRGTCHGCNYFLDLVAARIQFVHQFDVPAAVFKHFSIWGGNRLFCEICDLSHPKGVGLGIERIVHPDSLADVIAGLKQLTLGKATFVNPCQVTLLNAQQVKMAVEMVVLPLNDPPETWLAVVTNR